MESSRTPAHGNFVWDSDAKDSSFAVSFPKTPELNIILIGAELYQNPEEHDRLVLHFKGRPNEKREALVGGDPIKFTFRSGKIKSVWTGYVNSIEQDNGFQGGNTDVICVGASWVLKETSQKIYTKVTADQVITALAKKHGLEAITQRHPRVRASIVQAGQSDWQLARRLAKQTGFALRCDGTTIFFVSKEKIYQNKKASAPYFKYEDSSETGVTTRELRMTGTILEFEPHIADQSPDSGVRVDRVITGINPATGKVIQVTHPHKIIKPSNPGVVIPNESYFQS
jgi:hypothetical protein